MCRGGGHEHRRTYAFELSARALEALLSTLCLERASSHINGAPGERYSRAAQLPLLTLLLAHVCALALTLSVLSHSYARLSFRRLARWLIARSTVVERRITYYLYYDDVEIVNVNPLGQFL